MEETQLSTSVAPKYSLTPQILTAYFSSSSLSAPLDRTEVRRDNCGNIRDNGAEPDQMSNPSNNHQKKKKKKSNNGNLPAHFNVFFV
jgi:hypothetical protein